MAATPDCKGYWLVGSDGGVFSFGDARFFGSEGGKRLDQPIVGMAATADSGGYWLVAADGGVFSFGDAGFHGSTGGLHLVRPVVGMAPTAGGRGYWLVASDGGVFSFGDAGFHGSTGNLDLQAPIVSMAPTADSLGYWLLGADGGVFSFGDARFCGAATGGTAPAVEISRVGTPTSGCYTVLSGTGSLANFGSAGGPGSTSRITGPGSSPSTTPPAGVPGAQGSGAQGSGGGSSAASPASSGATAGNTPLLNAIGSSASDQQLAGAGYASVVIPASWASVEPAEGQYSATAVQQIQSEIDQATAAHMSATVDIGVQYAPAWVFGLGGGTRFVDQYGMVFSGAPGSGDDVANGVTDAAVRDQIGRYLSYLGSHLHGVAAVRVGGGPDNELRYPSGHAGGGPDAFWFYDPSSQASLPAGLQGWRPGTGTPQQAEQFLASYNGALDRFGQWLVTQTEADFPASSKVELLLPGWGQRAGEAPAAASALLIVSADEINEGLDWADLIPSLSTDGRVVAYTTWADAPSGGPTNPAPAELIHSLLQPGLLEGGESTGNGQSTLSGATGMFQQARRWGWYSVGWFFPGQEQPATQIAALFTGS